MDSLMPEFYERVFTKLGPVRGHLPSAAWEYGNTTIKRKQLKVHRILLYCESDPAICFYAIQTTDISEQICTFGEIGLRSVTGCVTIISAKLFNEDNQPAVKGYPITLKSFFRNLAVLMRDARLAIKMSEQKNEPVLQTLLSKHLKGWEACRSFTLKNGFALAEETKLHLNSLFHSFRESEQMWKLAFSTIEDAAFSSSDEEASIMEIAVQPQLSELETHFIGFDNLKRIVDCWRQKFKKINFIFTVTGAELEAAALHEIGLCALPIEEGPGIAAHLGFTLQCRHPTATTRHGVKRILFAVFTRGADTHTLHVHSN